MLVKEGDIAKVGSGLCIIEVDEDDNDAADKVEPEPSTPVQAKQPEPEPSPPSEPARRLHPLDPNNFSPLSSSSSDILATPSVRHYARQNSVDLVKVFPGSGRDGRVEKKDVDAFLTGKLPGTSSFIQIEQDAIVELTRTRYGMWKAMVKVRLCTKQTQTSTLLLFMQSLEIPHFGYSTSLDITSLYELLPTLNAHIPEHFRPTSIAPPLLAVDPSSIYPAPNGTRVPEEQQFTRLTYLPILLKMLAKSMIEWPLFRSSVTPSQALDTKPTLTVRPHADINIALSTPSGLYTPTLQGVDTQTIYGLASSLKHLSHLGRQIPCALTPKEMPKRGGTLTVSNVGAIGDGDYASPVLVPGGGVAIVALGRAKWVWDVNRGDGKGERRLKLGVSWSGDHRVVEGAELAAFVECWRSYVENPARLIADSV